MSTSVEEEFDFSGTIGAEAAAEAAKGGDFQREIEFFGLDASPSGIAQGKDKMLVRWLTNYHDVPEGVPQSRYNLGWITVPGHYAPTKPKPPYVKEGQNWPPKMSAGCRKGKPFVKKYNGECYICDVLRVKSSSQVWALAVEREQVTENGQILGYRDKTREVTARDENGEFIVESEDGDRKTYKKKTVPAFVVVQKSNKNFFQPLQAVAGYFGSLLDGDWLISRSGTKADDTTYSHIRVAEQFLPEGNPFDLPGGTKYDLGIPGLMEKVYPDMPDLRKFLVEKVSEDHFGRYFLPGWLPEGFEAKAASQQGATSAPATAGAGMMMTSSPSAAPPSAPEPPKGEEPSSAALDALKNRISPQG